MPAGSESTSGGMRRVTEVPCVFSLVGRHSKQVPGGRQNITALRARRPHPEWIVHHPAFPITRPTTNSWTQSIAFCTWCVTPEPSGGEAETVLPGNSVCRTAQSPFQPCQTRR